MDVSVAVLSLLSSTFFLLQSLRNLLVKSECSWKADEKGIEPFFHFLLPFCQFLLCQVRINSFFYGVWSNFLKSRMLIIKQCLQWQPGKNILPTVSLFFSKVLKSSICPQCSEICAALTRIRDV